ncbi:MAG: right-handed parallel beta-helix repeat-containing protein [Chloroflexi bacterium]|nr:right-handed parallel beta-helix repeat-containing protein [Chloroflexota bacterium]
MRRRAIFIVVALILVVAIGVVAYFLANRPQTPAEVALLRDAVDVPVGSDIQSLVDQHPPGTTYLIRAGLHRDQSIVPKDGDSFFGESGAVLNGAHTLDGFERSGDIWVLANFLADGEPVEPWFSGTCMPGFEGCNNGEAIFYDDVPLRHVLTVEEVGPGTWHFDYAARSVYLGDDPTGRTVEMAVNYQAFSGDATGVAIRGLTIEKYAGPGQIAALDGLESTNWIVENNIIRFNHGVGLTVGPGMQVIGNQVVHNGQIGVSGVGDGVVVRGNEIAYNNWSYYDPGWEAGGTKFVQTNGLLVEGNYVHHNIGPGLWTDIDNINVTIRNNIVVANASQGIFHEIGYDAKIYDNVVKFNNPTPADWLYGGQIVISSSRNAEIYDNVIAVSETGGNGITIVQQERGEGAYGAHLAINNVVRNNRIYHLGIMGQNGAAGEWSEGDFWEESNNRFDSNQYFVADTRHAYWGWENAVRTWDQIRQLGQETNGQISDGIPLDIVLPPHWRP